MPTGTALKEAPCSFPGDLLQHAACVLLAFLRQWVHHSSWAYPSSPARYRGYIEDIWVSIGYPFSTAHQQHLVIPLVILTAFQILFMPIRITIVDTLPHLAQLAFIRLIVCYKCSSAGDSNSWTQIQLSALVLWPATLCEACT